MDNPKFSGFFESAVYFSVLLCLALVAGGCGSAADSSPAETVLSAKPSNPSDSYTATFEFQCPEGGCSFECQLDTDQWSPCSSPAVYPGLAAGSHSFTVRAVSYSGVPDPTPETYVWTIAIQTVDTVPPDTIINTKPSDPSGSASATFTFSCDGGFCTFECQLDAGSWAACSQQKTYQNLSSGSHTFSVRAADTSGNVDPTPATYTWTIG